MRYIADHDFHIHSTVSRCCHDENQTPDTILNYAKENGFKRICLTNHFWDDKVRSDAEWIDEHNFSCVSSVLPLPKDDDVEFLFGCETDMDFNNVLGISGERFNAFDFIIVATTHLHLDGNTVRTKIATPDEAAFHWIDKIENLLIKDLPFHKIGIAHLTCTHLAKSVEERAKLLDLIADADLIRLFSKVAKLGAGIEINRSDMLALGENAPSILRIYKIAKECGCKFYCASDAHRVNAFDTAKSVLQTAVDAIGLTEDDKFHLSIDSENL